MVTITGTEVATTTAWGNAAPLDVALARIARHTTATVVELAIGARPVALPDVVLDAHRGRFRYIGHHTLPLGNGVNLRPELGEESQLAGACRRFGLEFYSAHPPNKKLATIDEFYAWAASYRAALDAVGVGFAVETMYVPRASEEAAHTGGYHLATADEVAQFCDWAATEGWEQPLVVDASHLHIGYCHGDWTLGEIHDLLRSPMLAELHVSENDGRVDAHRPLRDSHLVAGWVDGLCVPLVVDEGRRRQL